MIGELTFSNSTLTLLALLAVGLAGLAFVIAAFGSVAARTRVRPAGQPIRVGDDLKDVLYAQSAHIKRLEDAVRTLNRTDKKQDVQIRGTVSNLALVRYDAFEDVGGRLSFSCAMLDAQGTGVVLTAINGRQETRVYAKPVMGGRSSYNLSAEEEEAIRQALAAPEGQAVTAR